MSESLSCLAVGRLCVRSGLSPLSQETTAMVCAPRFARCVASVVGCAGSEKAPVALPGRRSREVAVTPGHRSSTTYTVVNGLRLGGRL